MSICPSDIPVLRSFVDMPDVPRYSIPNNACARPTGPRRKKDPKTRLEAQLKTAKHTQDNGLHGTSKKPAVSLDPRVATVEEEQRIVDPSQQQGQCTPAFSNEDLLDNTRPSCRAISRYSSFCTKLTTHRLRVLNHTYSEDEAGEFEGTLVQSQSPVAHF